MLVADASVIAPAVTDGGADGRRIRRRLRDEQLAAPDLLRLEVLSVLRRHHRAGGLDASRAAHAIDDLLALPIAVYPTAPLLPRCWELRDDLTASDASYAALAEVLDATLLTADARLARAPGLSCRTELA